MELLSRSTKWSYAGIGVLAAFVLMFEINHRLLAETSVYRFVLYSFVGFGVLSLVLAVQGIRCRGDKGVDRSTRRWNVLVGMLVILAALLVIVQSLSWILVWPSFGLPIL